MIAAWIIFFKTGSCAIIIWIIYWINPLTGLVLPPDNTNLTAKSEKAFLNDKRFWIPLHVYNAIETCMWIWQLMVFSDVLKIDHWFINCRPTGWLETYVFSVTWGLFTGLNAIQGHEMVHRKEWYNKHLGNWAYQKFFYSHFIDEHIQGHHKLVATPDDPATAKKGSTIYTFLPYSVVNQPLDLWRRECKRIKKEKGDNVPFALLVLNNKMSMHLVIDLVLILGVYFIFGWTSLKYQFLYAFQGMFYLELINYIEHYGMERQKDENGIYESINKMHSWNSVSSPTLFRLQRHSDHHAHSFRPYQILRRFDEAPFYQFEYLQAFLLCMISPLWFYIVDDRVDAIHELARTGKKSEKV
jgi:alkane 1-monooxygenase